MGFDDDRRSHLLLVTNSLLDTWQKWANNPDLKYVTVTFEEAVEAVVLLFSEGTIPGDLRRLTALVGDMEKHWEAWKKRAVSNPNKFQHPDTNFWAALEAISQHLVDLKRPPAKRLEPVAKLRALPGMTDHQICRTYGWFDANGNPELWKVEEEETDPGKHSYKLEGWLPPHERERVRIERAQAAAVDRAKEQRMAKIKQLTRPPAPEPIEDLLKLSGMSGKQICQMKHIDRDEFEQYCREHQLRMPSWDPPSGNQLSSVFDVNQDARDAEAIRDQAKASTLKQPKPAKPPKRVALEGQAEADTPIARDDDRPASVIQGAVDDEQEDDAEDNQRASVLRGAEEEVPAPEAAAAVEGEFTPEAQVVLYHKAGLKPEEIAADLATTDPTMDAARVKRIIRQFARNPSSIPLPQDAVV
jgi:hypothetical protein